MITVKDLEEQREQIQENLLSIFDGYDQRLLDTACDVIVESFNELISKLEAK